MAGTLPEFDLTRMPYSRRGSWFSLSRPQRPHLQPLGAALYLRTNHGRPHVKRELFRLDLIRDGAVCPHTEVATPLGVTLRPETGEGCVEIVLDETGSVRMRGVGVSLRLTAAQAKASLTIAYETDAGVTVNAVESQHRYHAQAQSGTLTLQAAWHVDLAHNTMHHPEVVLECGGATWEVSLDEFVSTWVPPLRLPFDEVLAEARQAFEAFVDALPPVPPRYAHTRVLAGYLLWSCAQRPEGLLTREAVYMSLNWMDSVWSWDNLFNMVALAGGHPELAYDQIALEIDHQDEFGAYPDCISDSRKHSNFSKPPVQGILLRTLQRLFPDWWTPERSAPILASVARFTRWWLTHRRDPVSGLCYYLHGNDSGWDNSSLFDRGVPLVAPDLNAFLVVQADWLAEMEEAQGHADAAKEWRETATTLAARIEDTLWLDGQYGALKLPEREVVRARSLVDCMPLLLGARLSPARQAALVERIETFHTPVGLATEHTASPAYVAEGYWRGPVWAPSTHLIALALQDIGETDRAAEVARRFCDTCVKSGFAENFHAETGAGLCDRAYTWTASVFLLLAMSLPRDGMEDRVPQTTQTKGSG